MSIAKNIKVIVPGAVFAFSLAATGVAYADQFDGARADSLGQYTAFKNQDAVNTNPGALVKNQVREQVKFGLAGNGRSDALGLAMQAKYDNPVQSSTSLAATKDAGARAHGTN